MFDRWSGTPNPPAAAFIPTSRSTLKCGNRLLTTISRAFRLQTFCHRLRRLGVAPLRRIFAVAPGARTIEDMDAELVHFSHFAYPARMNIGGVVMRRLADFRQPKLAVEHFS